MCADGYCRREGTKLSYSNCNLTAPIRCGDGRCVQYEYQCSSLACPFDRPYMCPDMNCVPFLKNCTSTMAYRPFKSISLAYNLGNSMSKIGVDVDGIQIINSTQKLLFVLKSTFEVFSPPKDSPHYKQLQMTGKQFNGNCSLKIEPVARDEVYKVNNSIESNRTVSFDDSYPFTDLNVKHYFTVRSPVINITTSGRKDDNEYFGAPLKVKFFYDPIKISTKKIEELKVN